MPNQANPFLHGEEQVTTLNSHFIYVRTKTIYPSCNGCPYDKGEGIYCIGYCIKEILLSREEGG